MFPFPSLDTLLTLPSVFIFLIPSAISTTSLSTYLNLVLFTLTWSTICLSYSPVQIEFFATLAVRILFFVGPCFLFLAFDTLLPSLSQSIKAQGPKALAVNAFTKPRARPSQRVFNLAVVSLSNLLLSTALQTAIDYIITELSPFRSALRINLLPPSPWAVAKEITIAYVFRGVLTYYIHRFLLHSSSNAALHRSPLAPVARQLTRWHQTWAHSLRTTVPLASAYDHPVPYLFHRFFPTYISTFMFRFHLLTYLLFVALVSLEEAFAFSGYTLLPSTILLAGIARRQEFHFEKGSGNYGPWGVMDWVHNTVIGDRDVVDDMRDEAVKHDLRGKASNAMDDVVRKGNNVAGQIRRDVATEIDDNDDDDEEYSPDVSKPSTTSKVTRAIRKRRS